MGVVCGYEQKNSLLLYFHLLLFCFQNFDQLSEFISKYFKVDLQEVELSVKGWNWGTAKFEGQSK